MPTRPNRPKRETLFSYGTLKDGSVQLALFGRRLAGVPDVLPRYRTAPAGPYLTVVFTGSDSDVVSGVRLTLTAAELAQADAYEADADYRRTRVRLGSGAEAWVYICPTRTSENG